MLKKYGWVIGALVAAAALLVIATRNEPAPTVATTEAPPTAPSTVVPTTTVTVAVVTPPPTASAQPLLIDAALDADDPLARRAEIEAALARKDVSALESIQKTDITKNGYEAAAAIDAVGKLSALAPEPAKKAGVKTLERWLKQETARKAPESLGNISILVDALADTKSKDAVAPLVAALDAANQPIHIETRIVEALTELDDRTAAPSVARFAASTRPLAPTDEMEKALVAEALAAADGALAKWK